MTSLTFINKIKQAAGILWILLAPLTLFFLMRTAATEIAKKPTLDTRIQWGVFVIVFIPIAVGLVLFGYYAMKGEYKED